MRRNTAHALALVVLIAANMFAFVSARAQDNGQISTPDEQSGAETARQIEHRDLRTAADERVFECVDFSMAMKGTIGQRDDVAVEKRAVISRLDPARADRDTVAFRHFDEPFKTRAIRNGLGQAGECFGREIANEPVTTHAALGKNHESRTCGRRLRRKAFHLLEIRIFIGGQALHLHGSNAQCSSGFHSRTIFAGPFRNQRYSPNASRTLLCGVLRPAGKIRDLCRGAALGVNELQGSPQPSPCRLLCPASDDGRYVRLSVSMARSARMAVRSSG